MVKSSLRMSTVFMGGYLMAMSLAFPCMANAEAIQRFYVAPDFIAPAPFAFAHTGDLKDANGVTVRGYNSTDEANTIIYTATFPLTAQKHGDATPFDILKKHVQGLQVPYIRPALELLHETTVSGNPALTWSIQYELPSYPGVKWTKYGVVIMKDHKIYQWAVTGIDGISRRDVKAIFLANLRHVELH